MLKVKRLIRRIKDFLSRLPTKSERDYLDVVITAGRLKKNPHFVEDLHRSLLSGRKGSFYRIRELLHLVPSDPYGDRDVLLQELRSFVKWMKETEAYCRALRKAGKKQASVNSQTSQS